MALAFQERRVFDFPVLPEEHQADDGPLDSLEHLVGHEDHREPRALLVHHLEHKFEEPREVAEEENHGVPDDLGCLAYS